jgi:hypothetical protein
VCEFGVAPANARPRRRSRRWKIKESLVSGVTAEKRDQAVHMSKTRLKQIKRKKQAEQAEEQKLSKDPQPQPRSLKMLKIKKKRPRVSLARMKAGRKALLGYKKTSLATS